ncbi:MAG: hypothetical protein IKQ01_00295 [Bacteroidales bacterium]|nr:hypothetical protein [Bacteroidales bacterium]
MKRLLPLLLLLAASACGTVRTLPVQDSTRVEVRVEKEYVVDTAWVELPVIVERVATLDTVSVLENRYAKSEAVVSGGMLSHSLETKPVKEPVKIQKEIVYRDSLVFRDRIVKEEVKVEKDLTPWQTLKMRTGGVCLIAMLLIIIYFVIKHLFNLNLFKL